MTVPQGPGARAGPLPTAARGQSVPAHRLGPARLPCSSALPSAELPASPPRLSQHRSCLSPPRVPVASPAATQQAPTAQRRGWEARRTARVGVQQAVGCGPRPRRPARPQGGDVALAPQRPCPPTPGTGRAATGTAGHATCAWGRRAWRHRHGGPRTPLAHAPEELGDTLRKRLKIHE